MPKKKQKLADFKLPEIEPGKPDFYTDYMQQESVALNLVEQYGLDKNLVITATGMKTLPTFDGAKTQKEAKAYVEDYLIDGDLHKKGQRRLPAIRQLSEALLEEWNKEGIVRGTAVAVSTIVEPALIKYLAMLMIEHCYACDLTMPYALVELMQEILQTDQFQMNRINRSGSKAREAERRIIAFVTANWDRSCSYEIICEFVELNGTAKTSKSQVSAVLKRHEDFIASMKKASALVAGIDYEELKSGDE